MKFTKPLIAVAAVLLATTFANAQTTCAQGAACSNGGLIQPTVIIDQAAFMDLYPVDWSSANWIQKNSGAAGIATLSPQLIGAILVQTNMGKWDITVKSTDANFLKNGANNLQAIAGAVTAPANARLLLYVCKGDLEPTTAAGGIVTTSPCTVAPTGAATATTGKLDTLTAANTVSIAKALNKATGLDATDLTATGVDADKNVVFDDGGNLTPADPGYIDKKVAPSGWFGIYAALQIGTAAAPQGVAATDLTSNNGTYKNNLIFTLTAKY